MSDKNKQIHVQCKMFLRFLKENKIFHEWRVEGDNRIMRDSFVRTTLKFYAIADMWKWYISYSRTVHSAISDNPIYNVVDQTLHWACTKRGHTFWSKVNSRWKNLYRKYHVEREIGSMAYGKSMTDDFDAFRTVMNEFGKDYLHYT